MNLLLFFGLLFLPPEKTWQAKAAEDALERADFALAASLASAELKVNPRDERAHVIAARAMIGENKALNALDQLEAALNIDPKNADALYYFNKLTAVLARQELTRLYTLAPDSGRVHQLMADSLHAQGDSAGEERELLLALQKMPHSVPVLLALGELTRYQARYEEATEYYVKASENDKRNVDALYGAGACAIFLEDYKKAEDYLEQALKLDPHSPAARLALGDAFLRDQQYAKAVNELAQLTKAEPSAKQAWALYGKALREAGMKAEADAAFNRYRELLRTSAGGDPK